MASSEMLVFRGSDEERDFRNGGIQGVSQSGKLRTIGRGYRDTGGSGNRKIGEPGKDKADACFVLSTNFG